MGNVFERVRRYDSQEMTCRLQKREMRREQILLNRRLISEMNINSDYHGFFTLMMLFVAKSYEMRNYCSHVHPKTPKERKFPKNNPTGRYGKRIFLKLLQPCPFEISQRTTPLADHDIAYESFVKGWCGFGTMDKTMCSYVHHRRRRGWHYCFNSLKDSL